MKHPSIILVCDSTHKANTRCMARDMFPGMLSTPRVEYVAERAERLAIPWFFVTPVHGFLSPEQIIDPYNTTLKDVQRDGLAGELARAMARQITTPWRAWFNRPELHAGAGWRGVVRLALLHADLKYDNVLTPMLGQSPPSQRQFYLNPQPNADLWIT